MATATTTTTTVAGMAAAAVVVVRRRMRLVGRECMRVGRSWRYVTGVHHLPYFLVLVVQRVSQLRLLEAGGRHALVDGAGRRVGRVEARLDQRLAGLGRDHRLQFPRGERVDVARLAGHQQHDLRARQCRQFVSLRQSNPIGYLLCQYQMPEKQQTHLLHDASLSLGEGGVPSQFVVDKLHFDLDTSLGLLAVGWRRLFGLGAVLASSTSSLRRSAVVVVVHGAVAHANGGHGHVTHHGVLFQVETCHFGRPLGRVVVLVVLLLSRGAHAHAAVAVAMAWWAHPLSSSMSHNVVLVLQDVGIRTVAVQVHSITSQGTVGVAHGVPGLRHATTTLTLHDDFSRVVNS